MPNALGRIENIVVLMLENRPFDHMLGFLKSDQYAIEGLTGDETNPEAIAVDNPVLVRVSKDANYTGDLDIDPAHDVPDVNDQLFGATREPFSDHFLNQGFVDDYSTVIK